MVTSISAKKLAERGLGPLWAFNEGDNGNDELCLTHWSFYSEVCLLFSFHALEPL